MIFKIPPQILTYLIVRIFYQVLYKKAILMNYPAASSGVSKTTTGKILRPKGRGIHPDGNK
jgi:hypothetical protein